MILRKVRPTDKDIILKWRNDQETRKNSFNSNKISHKEHEKWFEQELKNNNMFICEENEPVAFIHFTRKNKQSEIHINVNPEKRGRGIGKECARLACQNELKERTREIIAKIKIKNKKSINLFRELGFSQNKNNKNNIIIMKKKLICAIIQARTGSTRLPGKVLMKLNSQSVLEHVINQIKKCKTVDKIIVATSGKKQDDFIEKIASKTEVNVFRGNENNVLDRFLKTAEKFSLSDENLVIRITADCPLVNPEIIDKMILSHLRNRADYTFNNVEKSMLPRGFDAEIFYLKTLKKSSKLIEKMNKLEKRKYYQEHVSKYIADKPELFKHNLFIPEKELRRPDIKLAVDTKKDFDRIKFILKRLKNKELTPENIVKLFPKPEIAIYATATKEIGTGHLKRMKTLANLIQNKIDCSVTFYTNNEPQNKNLLKNLNFKTIDLSKNSIKSIVKNINAHVHIIDILGATEKFQDNIIIIDTPLDKKDRIIISPEFRRRKKINKEIKNILISMGGSDPDNATETIIKALKNYNSKEKNIQIVIGPMFQNKERLKKSAEKIDASILENVDNMPELMHKADIGIGSAGATICEMIASGLPCISIAVSEQQIPNTTAVGKNGFAINLGRKPEKKDILNAIEKLESYEMRKIIFRKQKQYKSDTDAIIQEIIDSLIPD